VLLCLSAGCAYTQKGTSEWGFKQETSWSVYQRTTTDEATFKADLQPVIDYLIQLRDARSPDGETQ